MIKFIKSCIDFIKEHCYKILDFMLVLITNFNHIFSHDRN
jgi:hypothetical protein